ncbi:glutathione S-transferase family protein [Roseospira goensis]|uniref:Glutathione S-transferase n=1 Tax=Roseospira goensis TaxID=391922 RepID=A0A7W6RYA2_9PROT|nr:glutathione S-transferase family protein [Roseospira goensis]MBB4284814.1 glutathione S-transferase [Roseospira goensis]
MILYDFLPSGNCYKIRLLLARLGLRYTRRDVDILKRESRTPEFLALNPNGRVPVLVLDDGTALAESNAILWYLADTNSLLPDSPLDRARTLQWMFFEQYSHEPNVAVARFWLTEQPEMTEDQRRALPNRQQQGRDAIGLMERHLADQPFFVGDRFGLADIALFAYTHVAPEGGIELDPFPHVRAWIDRVAAQPGHVAITDAP